MIASDITRLAFMALRKEGQFSPDRLLDSFLQALGPEGTLILPAYTFHLHSGETFDRAKSLPTTGALAEAALKRPDFQRTRHPLHSFLVSGKYADELAAMDNISSFGADSPFAFFKKKNTLMVMIGTNVTDAFTFVHHAEEMEKVKYRKYRDIDIHYFDKNDEEGSWKKFRIYAKKSGRTMNLDGLEELFRKEGILKEDSFNGIGCSQVLLGDAYPIIREDIRSNHARNISHFSLKLMVKESLKSVLSSLHLHKTLTEKISRASGSR